MLLMSTTRVVVLWLIIVNALLVSLIGIAAEARKLGKHDDYSPSPSPSEGVRVEEDQEQVMIGRNHHRSVDRSVAGGGVIIGVLATGFLVAVFCYIRATRRKHVQLATSHSDDTSMPRKNINIESS